MLNNRRRTKLGETIKLGTGNEKRWQTNNQQEKRALRALSPPGPPGLLGSLPCFLGMGSGAHNLNSIAPYGSAQASPTPIDPPTCTQGKTVWYAEAK
ncbi:uncharacterized protein VTP21DRAFT_1938 [Calcarisporiella thermophila]|uniref:uncharacterized protein n=1 Tax=Calcarisporiella thermophila TaxID=911321 RepID=UPI003743C453